MRIRDPHGRHRNIPATAEAIWPVLEDGVKTAVVGPLFPPLYRYAKQTGLRYRREPILSGSKRRDWYNLPGDVMAEGHGDCEDLAMWRAAWLRRNGEPDARVGLIEFYDAAGEKAGWHAVVLRRQRKANAKHIYTSPSSAYRGLGARLYAGPDLGWDPFGWYVEDPSFAMGMKDAGRDLSVSGVLEPELGAWPAWWVYVAAAAGLALLWKSPGRQLSDLEMQQLLQRAGWPSSAVPDAIRVVKMESGGWTNARARNQLKSGQWNIDRGLWQISSVYHPHVTDAQADNAFWASKYALQLWRQHGWKPWIAARKARMVEGPTQQPGEYDRLLAQLRRYNPELARRLGQPGARERVTVEELRDVVNSAVEAEAAAERRSDENWTQFGRDMTADTRALMQTTSTPFIWLAAAAAGLYILTKR